ncbi:glutamine--fructose-6-phosphate aminotransferase, partial [Acinetobacter baumannii]
AILKADELILKNLGNEKQTPFITKLDMDLAEIEKGGYDHFMLKEIYEQPDSVFDCLRGRLLPNEGKIVMNGVENNLDILKNASRIMI